MEHVRHFLQRFNQPEKSKSTPLRSPRTTRPVPLKSWENGQWALLTPDDLERVSVVAQALDNQWVPQHLLMKMLANGQALRDVHDERTAIVRDEYIRALINAEQVVINRAFLFNNPIVSQDYSVLGEQRDAFKDLIGEGAIVPYLYREATPVDRPLMDLDEPAFEAWTQICQEVAPRCVRLDWDDARNVEKTNLLTRRFDAWVRTADNGDMATFARDLGLPPEAQEPFRQHLRKLGMRAFASDTPVLRGQLYEDFICFPGTKVSDGKYDAQKPFVSETKQLLDLSYNTNLPDSLGKYALTPIGALPRTSLQELLLIRDSAAPMTDKDLIALVRNVTFDLAMRGTYLERMGELTLADVRDIRNTDAWYTYIEKLNELLSNPFAFEQGAGAVYKSYEHLARTMTGFLERRQPGIPLKEWMPTINLIVNIGGAILTAAWTPVGFGVGGAILWNLVGNVAQNTAGVIARVAIKNIVQRKEEARLESSIDFLHRHLRDARSLWQDLPKILREQPGFVYDPTLGLARRSNINFADQQISGAVV